MHSTPTPTRRALVIGGGIGGLTAAMALQRAGIEPVVYEAHDRPADYAGLFLNLASNGIAVLRTLGVDSAGVDAAPAPRMVLWSGSGRRLGEVANGLRLPDGTVSVVLKRGRLQRALADAAASRGIAIEYGKRLADYAVTAHGVIARFSDGTEAAGDLLIGADGLHSRTRRILSPGAPDPTYTGLVSVGGFARSSRVAPTPDTQHFVFGRRAFFGYLVRSSGEIYWFANTARPDEPSRQELAGVSSAEWKRRLLALFAGDSDLIGEIIRATEGEIGGYPVHDIPTLSVWHRGPVALVGDAVHAVSPNTGQGASLAMEDALVLARCLRDIADPERAFAEYERLRRGRVERVVAYSRRIGGSKALSNPLAVWLRDRILPFALKRFANPESHAWMYRYRIDWDERAA